jgi:hypothetical protein
LIPQNAHRSFPKIAKDYVAYAHHAIGGVDIFQEKRVFLDMLADHVTLPQLQTDAEVYYDFDSMHGVSLDTPFVTGGLIMPVLDKKLVLDKSIHLTREVSTDDEEVPEVSWFCLHSRPPVRPPVRTSTRPSTRTPSPDGR